MKPECRKKYREDGGVGREEWFLNDELHRTDGPAVIIYRKDSSVEEEHWRLNGKYYRTNGPAIVRYRKDGSVEEEHWYSNNEFHRTDGPAIVYYRKNGSVSSGYWFLNGSRIKPEQHLIQVPKTEEEKIELINEFVFIKENNNYIFIKEWLKRDKEFYKKYRMLIE